MQPNVVLLAGGCGTRLWPLSTPRLPKQFITLPRVNISSFQLSLRRSLSITSPQNIIIIINNEHHDLLYQQIYNLGLDPNNFNLILEQYSNNTGVAIYCACQFLLQKELYGLTYFFPTDHLIDEESYFFKEVLSRVDKNRINIFGQRSFNLCSNFGYMIEGESICCGYYKVEKFVEKPEYKEIEELKKNNQRFYRNLGIYLATAPVLYSEFQKFYKGLPSVVFEFINNKHNIQVRYKNLPIDKMISERSKILSLIDIEFEWRDIGSIESLYQYCDGSSLDCKIDPMHIVEFNKQNKEFKLNYSNDRLYIINY